MELDKYIEIELVARQKARENLLIFTQYTMPKYQVNWHHEVIAEVLQDFYDKKFQKLMVFLPPQTGKFIKADVPVLTTKGWKPHEELRAGDIVYGKDFKPVKVLQHQELYKEPCYQLDFSNGGSIIAGRLHEWEATVVNHYLNSVSINIICETQDLCPIGKDIIYIASYDTQGNRHRNTLTDIKPIGTHWGSCIQVEGGFYLVGESCILTHNSELSTRRFPAYKIGRDPDSKIAIATYAQDFASKFNRDIQKILASTEYGNVFPEISLPKVGDSYVKNSYEFDIVNYTGNIKTVGVGGGITGNPVDMGIVDDPIKGAEQAFSKKYRDWVWNWYLQDFLTRLHNDSQQLITLTRWHEDDLAGRILEVEGNDWEIVKIPAINTRGQSKYDPRNIGEVLWPAKHSLERMKKIEENSPTVFMSMYQQEPTDEEGEILKKEDFTIVNILDVAPEVTFEVKHAIADTAYTTKAENDPSAIIVYSVFENMVYIWDYLEVREELSNLVTRMTRFISRHFSKRSVLYVEPKASGQSVINLLKTQTLLTVKEHKNPAVDKVARVWSAEPIVAGKRVILIEGAWNTKFINDCASFPKIKHDEAPDLLAMVISRTLLNPDKKGTFRRKAYII